MDAVWVGGAAIALGLGFRHGVDADHVVALGGLSSLDGGDWRRALAYSAGHLAVLGALVSLVLVTGWRLPVAFDPLAAAVVAATLVVLGIVALHRAVRPTPPAPARARGGLLLGAAHGLAAQTPTQLAAIALATTPAGAAATLAAFGLGMLAAQGGLVLALRLGVQRAPRLFLAGAGVAGIAGGLAVGLGA